jgi:hypothetical protein
MHPDLEGIVSADEEARSHVILAGDRRERELAAARAARDAAIEKRRRESSDALEGELQVIRTEGDARLAELQRQQALYVASLAEAGERKLDDAVTLYLRIVCEATP